MIARPSVIASVIALSMFNVWIASSSLELPLWGSFLAEFNAFLMVASAFGSLLLSIAMDHSGHGRPLRNQLILLLKRLSGSKE